MKNCKKKKILKIAIVAGVAATACAIAFEIKRMKKLKAALAEAEAANAEEKSACAEEEIAGIDETPAEAKAPVEEAAPEAPASDPQQAE